MNSNFPLLNSLHSNISMHILHTVHQIFLKVLMENLFNDLGLLSLVIISFIPVTLMCDSGEIL